MTIYAIGDVHGQLEKLIEAHLRISQDQAEHGGHDARIVHVGDLVDRGPDSRGVLDYLIERRTSGCDDILLLGNHDRMMGEFLKPQAGRDPLRGDLSWLDRNMGGRTTLASYGIDVSFLRPMRRIHRDARQSVPAAHLRLLGSLRLSHSAPGLFFCHAGIRPGVPLAQQDANDLVWIRHEFLDDPRDHGALIVHGHTPVRHLMHCGNHVNIDTGAAYGGPLTAIAIEDGVVYELTGRGRVLVPAPLLD